MALYARMYFAALRPGEAVARAVRTAACPPADGAADDPTSVYPLDPARVQQLIDQFAAEMPEPLEP
jgi:malonyl CoA-acyl carrier protein transacylase